MSEHTQRLGQQLRAASQMIQHLLTKPHKLHIHRAAELCVEEGLLQQPLGDVL